jgi:hypothetical protein
MFISYNSNREQVTLFRNSKFEALKKNWELIYWVRANYGYLHIFPALTCISSFSGYDPCGVGALFGCHYQKQRDDEIETRKKTAMACSLPIKASSQLAPTYTCHESTHPHAANA